MDPFPEQEAIATERHMDSRLNRYLTRIEHLINRDRSRSVSPIGGRHNKKILARGPMINRIDTYIKYEHPLHIIARVMQHRDFSLLKDFFTELKGYQGHLKRQKIYRFVPVRVVQQENRQYDQEQSEKAPPRRRSNILCLQLRNYCKRTLKEAFDLVVRHPPRESKTITNLRSRSIAPTSNKPSEPALNKKPGSRTFVQAGLCILSRTLASNRLRHVARFLQLIRLPTHPSGRKKKWDILTVLIDLPHRRLRQVLDRLKRSAESGSVSRQHIKRLALAVAALKFHVLIRESHSLAHRLRKVVRVARLLGSKGQKQLVCAGFQLIASFSSRQKVIAETAHKQTLPSALLSLYKARLANGLLCISRRKQFREERLGRLARLMAAKVLARLSSSFAYVSRLAIAEEGLATPRSRMQLSKSEKVRASMSFLSSFGRLYQLLLLKEKHSLDHGFHALYELNQEFKKHLAAAACIFKVFTRPAFARIKSSGGHRAGADRSQATFLRTKLLAQALSRLKSRHLGVAFRRLLPPSAKKSKLLAGGMCRSLLRLHKRCLVHAYSKIKCCSLAPDRSDTADSMGIFNEVIEFLNERNQNFEKIQSNYRKLKTLASFEQEDEELQGGTLESRSLVMSLKSKIVYD